MHPEKTHRVLLSLGSNLGEREQYLSRARAAIASRHRILRQSRELNNAALIVTDQPDFLNQIIEIETTFRPEELLQFLKQIEKDLGRMHRERYGPREIDLDILNFEDVEMQTEHLRLPHPGLVDRNYLHVLLSEPPFSEAEKKRYIDAARKGMLPALLLPLILWMAPVAALFLSGQASAAPIMLSAQKQELTEAAAVEALPVLETGSFYYRSPAPSDAQEKKAFEEALALHYADFRNDFKGFFKKIGSFDASVLNDLAIMAAEDQDIEGAEALFRLSLARRDALPVRLNLIFLYLSQHVKEAQDMLAELQRKLSEERNLVVLQALRIRRFDTAADEYLRLWMHADALLPLSPSLKTGAKETAALFEAAGRKKEALTLYQEIDRRAGGTDPRIIAALARLTEEVQKDSRLAISLYRRLLSLTAEVDDDDLRHYLRLLFQSGDYRGVEQIFLRLRSPQMDDLRLLISARLRLNPDASVEPLFAEASRMLNAELPNSKNKKETLFDAMFLQVYQSTWKIDIPYMLRMEFFGSADPADIAKDREIQRSIY